VKAKGFRGVVVAVLVVLAAAQMGAAQDVIDMDFKDAPIGDVFQVLGELAGLNVLIDPTVTGNVSFYLKELTVNEALELLIQTTGYDYQIVNNTLIVASKEKLAQQFQKTDSAFVVLNNVAAADANQLLNVIIPGLRTYTDHDLNMIVLFGSVAELEYAEKILRNYDSISTSQSSVSEMDGQLVTKRIYIEYGNGPEIAGMLQRSFPLRQFIWDGELRILTGAARESEWEQIQIIVAAKDHPAFIVKGIVQGTNKTLVLIEYNDRTSLLNLGDSLDGWVLKEVDDKRVFFAKEDRSFTLEMGRQ